MGSPRFQGKTFERPKHPWEGERIKEENELVIKYGLKNKREIWKSKSILRNYRIQARNLQAKLRYGDKQADIEMKQLLGKLESYGLLGENSSLNNVLSLSLEDILNRRLQTVVYIKGLAKSPKQSRQFITHRHIIVGNRRVNVPGYFVKKIEEEIIAYSEFSPLADDMHPMRVSELPVEDVEEEKESKKKDKKETKEESEKKAGEEEVDTKKAEKKDEDKSTKTKDKKEEDVKETKKENIDDKSNNDKKDEEKSSQTKDENKDTSKSKSKSEKGSEE